MQYNQYTIERINEARVVLRDSGDGVSVTNSAEAVLESLAQRGTLRPRVFYYDSDGDFGELLHDGSGNFRGFGFPKRSSNYA